MVEEEPAESVERGGELIQVAEIAPESNSLVELYAPRVGVSEPGNKRTRRRERTGARTTARRRAGERTL